MNNAPKARLFCTAVAFASLVAISPARADDSPTISIMVGGISKFIYLPAKLADQLGYFKDEKLNVELLSQPAGVDAENELLSGSVQAVASAYDHTIDLQSKGKEVRSIATFLQVPGEVEVVSKASPMKSMADAKGKTLGVTGLGSSTDFLTQYMALKYRITSKEYSTLPVGADNSFIAAIQQRRIDAGMTTEPTVSRLLQKGDASVMVDMRTVEGTQKALGGIYPFTGLYVNADWLASHKQQAAGLARAIARTMVYIHTHSPEEIADKMPKDYYGGDKALYVQALKSTMAMYTPDGKMPAGGPENVLKILSTINPAIKGKHIDLNRTYTNEFVSAAKGS
ncbi:MULTISPECIES: ABC transporter substrate-binding protein [Burkholderiaceae]|uniref:ABC transporter substrate-binding protein n=1 Tax=Burkholderiaceae TaxID=119060 RepID=UPI0014201E1D|nr:MULTISPECIES: ABC transporter substrate-binding protein [Burkholderiaceae]MBN3845666.1 ABC transporter substrate-binding protein [Paraburkholderia sp. Ac-20342]NIF51104.1 transporter substrate-binding domain-containing protein [Burkholderia sp. Ax-1724]